jgi:hypothetical protein
MPFRVLVQSFTSVITRGFFLIRVDESVIIRFRLC